MFLSPNPSCGSPEESWWPGWGMEGSFWVKLQVVTAQSNLWNKVSLSKTALKCSPLHSHLFQQTFHLPLWEKQWGIWSTIRQKDGTGVSRGNWSKPPSDFLRFAVNAVKQLPVSSAAVVKEKSSISGASQSSRMVLLHGWQVSLSSSKQVSLPAFPYPLAFSPTSSFTLAWLILGWLKAPP